MRSAALRTANSILLARQRAEQELAEAKETLERRNQELARSLSMMRATLEATTDGILVTDDAGRVTDFNETYVAMWRLPRAALDAHGHLLEAVGPQCKDPDALRARIELIYATAPLETFDVIELADGRVLERFSRVQFLDERAVGRVWSFRDVTEHRRAEETLREAARERTLLLDSERAARTAAERLSHLKDEFLATLSHELRTPLSAILGWALVLRQRPTDTTDLERGIEAIERNARAQTLLIEDLLDMSRISSGKVRLDVQPVDPVSFIEAAVDTLRPAASAKGIRIERVLDPRAGPVSGDPHRLQQVMWNLLSNAIKFTPRDGAVQVVLARVRSYVEISVSDTGIGISPAFLPYIFERFRQADAGTTRRHGGLGLGLSIVRRLVEMHGGTVRAASPGEGQGATLAVQLPSSAAHRERFHEERLHPSPPSNGGFDFDTPDLGGLKVLVVDDQADARDLIGRILEECGAGVVTASTAAEAIEMVQRERPDVLVSDIGMPDVDGFELLRRIQALGPTHGGRIPAIALTALARSEDRTRALRAGFQVHVAKPVEPSELLATVASVAGRTGGRGGPPVSTA